MALKEVRDVSYHKHPTRDVLREFDLYYSDGQESAAPLPLICFVHGGAWRSEDKADHSALARSLVSATTFPVAVPNYRLSSVGGDIQHPDHAKDILDFLIFISSEWPDHVQVFDRQKIYLIGHSCSAHMLASILLDSSSISPSLTPSASLINAVQGVVMSEGIYDIDRILVSFPAYRAWFIEAAFGVRSSYAAFDTTRLSIRAGDIRWLVVHSKGDMLVDMIQSEAMLGHLKDITARAHVSCNMHELDSEHDALLSTATYLRIVADFIKQVAGP